MFLMIDPSATVQTHFSLEIRIPLQTHTMLEKTTTVAELQAFVLAKRLDLGQHQIARTWLQRAFQQVFHGTGISATSAEGAFGGGQHSGKQR